MSSYGKNEKRFNFIDVLIILAVIVIVLSVVFRGSIMAFFGDGERRSECVIEFQSESVPQASLEYIKDGMKLTWLEHELEIGVLESVSQTPATLYIPQGNGEYTKVGDTENYTLTGKIKADVLFDDGCYIGGTAFLTAGMTLTVCSENVQFEITVIGINY